MNVLGLIFFILFLVGAIVILVLGLINVSKSVKSQGQKLSYEILLKKLLIYGIAFAVSLTSAFLFIYAMNDITAKWNEYLAAGLGGLIFSFSFFFGLTLFITHYYGKNINEKLDKWFFRWMIISIISSFIFLFVTLDGFADYINLTSPLPNGINFEEGWAYPGVFGEKPNIAWYALCILTGAIIVYFYCDHQLYRQYGRHGILESTFLVALPAGIIGARLFYVIGNWNSEFANDPMSMFEIWNGGLTILGGALTGIVVGVLWFMWRNKGYNIFIIMDIALPSILIAQAVGRWGNFFNCEVHGIEMSGTYWSWLPKIIYNNMQFGHDGNTNLFLQGNGNIFVPLFLIEGAINLLGFFLIAYLFGKKLRKFTDFGDLAAGYFIWYGLVRAIMEPLRDSRYIMDSFWSWFWSLAFIAFGALAIILNHTIRNIIKNKKGLMKPKTSWFKTGLIGSSVLLFVSLALIICSIVMIAQSDHTLQVGFSPFNLGLIILTVGISLFGGLAVSIPYIVRGYRLKRSENA